MGGCNGKRHKNIQSAGGHAKHFIHPSQQLTSRLGDGQEITPVDSVRGLLSQILA